VSSRDLQSLRISFKRAFCRYFLDLSDPTLIADPTEAFAAAAEYLSALKRSLGGEEFLRKLDEELVALAGEAEQDLRQRLRDRSVALDFTELGPRLRECIEYALQRLTADS